MKKEARCKSHLGLPSLTNRLQKANRPRKRKDRKRKPTAKATEDAAIHDVHVHFGGFH